MKEGHDELRPVTSEGVAARLRRILGRPAPRARVTAPSTVRMGDTLEVEWRVDHAPGATLVIVSLSGAEVAHRRLSARTGISVETDRHEFVTLALDRRMLAAGATAISGRGATTVPRGTVPSLTAKLNQIVWSVVVEVCAGSSTLLRREFPLTVLPGAS